MSVYDPAYAYLFNGLNLANFKIVLGLTGHPGTPLQILISVIIRITYLFGNDSSLVDAVLINPELYLANISIVLVLINTVTIFLTGYFIFGWFKNLSLAIFIQLSLFFSKAAMFFASFVMAEPMLTFTELILIIYIFKYLHESNERALNKYIILFAVISGFGLAVKVVFLPVILIPFLVFKGIKARLKYGIITVAAFFIFILPAISRFGHFILWIKRLIIFTGKYGTGEPAVVNLSDFAQNLLKVFKDEYIFTIVYAIIILTIGLYLHSGYRKLLKESRYYRLLVIIFIAVTAQIIIVAKHYSFHYMIPAHILIATTIFVIITIYKELGIIPAGFIKRRILTFAVILFGFFLLLRLIINYSFSPDLNNPSKETVSYIEKNRRNKPVIIVNNKHGKSAFMESALYFGMSYADNQKHFYGRTLKKKFPDTYFYNVGSGEFYDWQITFPAFNIASRYSRMWLYFVRKDNNLLQKIVKNFTNILSGDYKAVDIKELYINNRTGEVIYELSVDNSMIKSLIKVKREISCNCETIDNNHFISSDGKNYFDNGNLRNNKIFFRGGHSVKLTGRCLYGLGIKIKIEHGEVYKINVWRLSKEASGILVATTDVPGEYYKAGASIQDVNGEWEKIELNVRIPENVKSDTLHIYIWNNLKEIEVYFDDFSIRQIEVGK